MPEYLQTLATNELFGIFLILTRIGMALTFFPGFGEAYVTPRARLAVALMLAILLIPMLLERMPDLPDSPFQILTLVFFEVAIGAFFGLVARIIFTALEVGGMIMAFQVSLGNATIFNPAMATQGSIISVFLTITAIVLLFATDLHHLMLSSIIESYAVFTPGRLPPTDDTAYFIARIVSKMFTLALQFAAPLVVLGLLFYLGLGLLGRLMPQIQVFFLAIPLQILLGFFIFTLVISTIFYWFLQNFEETMENFVL